MSQAGSTTHRRSSATEDRRCWCSWAILNVSLTSRVGNGPSRPPRADEPVRSPSPSDRREERSCVHIRRNTRYHRTHSTPTTASIAAATPAPTSSPRPAPLPLLIVDVHLTPEMLRHYLRTCVQLVLHLSHVQTFGCRSMDACQTEGIPYQSTASHSRAAPQ